VLAALPLSATAGTPSKPRIINPLGAYWVPWQAALYPSHSSPDDMFCGGTIRDETHVITAAHCVDSPESDEAHELRVAVGFVDRTAPGQSVQERGVTVVSSHPQYHESGRMEYDAAVLTLESPLTLAPGVNAGAPPLNEKSEVGAEGIISGWGDMDPSEAFVSPELLQLAIVDVFPNSTCAAYGNDFIADAMLCAGRRLANGQMVDACQGDSGGPLVRQVGTFPNVWVTS
jgi:secreted trypsin-like serine protease